MPEIKETTHLKDLWNEAEAQRMPGDQLALLRYRSNLLGADLRITNFGGGNTSSKIDLPDPFTGGPVRVLAVKGSGGDLGSITESGFALLYLDRLEQLKGLYRGEDHEDDMVRYYPLSAFGGVLAFNRMVDAATAEEVAKLFVECIAAPGFDEKSKAIFAAKKNLRLLELPPGGLEPEGELQLKRILGGMLV